ncbi:hypothetical protein M514_14182, partial [Trichuris suis]|uniref:DUF7041 domain-containing protein n=1 Tax=Trichuris suis TaxID=68888 RepID=A0A085LIZ5_9BILA
MDTTAVNSKFSASALAVKLPQFWPQNAKLWFAQAEAQFALSNVTASLTKYYYTIASLTDAIGSDVDDLLDNKGDTPYEVLKAKLLERFTTSTEEKFHSLMDASPIDDQRPTQLLRHMRRMATGVVDPQSSMFRQLFLQRLPPSVQLILKAIPTADVDELARTADKMLPMSQSVSTLVKTGTFHESAELQALRDEVTELREQVRSLAITPTPPRGRRSSSTSPPPLRVINRRRQRSPQNFPSSPICYYHRTFGRQARRCRPPCTFQGN